VWRLIKWKWFDRIVMFAILLNCVFLAMYDPLSPDGSSWNVMLEMAENFFTVAFTVEFALQVVARNFIIGPGAYLHSPWYVLDFTIVMTGLISLAMLAMVGALQPLTPPSSIAERRLVPRWFQPLSLRSEKRVSRLCF
jgi:hypothetical protein